MNDIAQMLRRDLSVVQQRAERNRQEFPDAAAMLDVVRTMDPSARMAYAANNAGKTIGKRDPGPFVSGERYVSACDWNAKVYGGKRRAA